MDNHTEMEYTNFGPNLYGTFNPDNARRMYEAWSSKNDNKNYWVLLVSGKGLEVYYLIIVGPYNIFLIIIHQCFVPTISKF